MDEKWEKFLGEVEKIRLFVMQEPPTLADKKQWVLSQVAPTIVGLILADYGDMNWLTVDMGRHAERMNKHLKSLITRENPGWREMLADYCGDNF